MRFDSPLVDGHNRPINYLRLAVTDSMATIGG